MFTPRFSRILKPALIIGLLFLLGSSELLLGDSIRINNRVIKRGMSKGKVFLLAGEPVWKSEYLLGDYSQAAPLGDPLGLFSNGGSFVGYGGNLELIGPVSVEEWLYDQGSNRLMQLLRFKNERLVDIESVGYGFGKFEKDRTASPSWATLQVGDTTYELLNKVGQPTITEDRPEVSLVRVYGSLRKATLHFRSADVSWWYYNAGSNRLFRIVKLLNGRVAEIETEGFGE